MVVKKTITVDSVQCGHVGTKSVCLHKAVAHKNKIIKENKYFTLKTNYLISIFL